jgi:hypothetical protein
LVDIPLGASGRITDAVLQDDGKIVLSTATVAGNGRILRLLPTGRPDPDFADGGAFVVEGDSADRNEIEKLAWSKDAGLWAAGTVMTRNPRVGLLLTLDDSGAIPASFNGGALLETVYEGIDDGGSLAFPLWIEASLAGVTVTGRADHDRTDKKRVVVGRHRSSGELDESFGDGRGYFVIEPDLVGFNVLFFGIDVSKTHLTFEILTGDGAGGLNPDRVLVQRYFS